MARLTVKCPQCGKIAEITQEQRIPALGVLFKTYSCGHSTTENILAEQKPKGKERNENWNKLREYQKRGVEFIEQSNFNCLLADSMGLGKTIQVIQAIRENSDKFKCILYVVKSALKFNWAVELQHWYSADLLDMPYIIGQGDTPILPGFKHYIISMSLLKKKYEEIVEKLNPTLIVIDESHNFKNWESQRSIFLRKIIRDTRIKHVICTSGTPILNRAGEYWPTLNMIKPEHWPSQKQFAWTWCKCDDNGKPLTILDFRKDEFLERISPYVLRREKREVLHDLPEFDRQLFYLDIKGSPMAAEYNRVLGELEKHTGQKGISKNNLMVTFGFLNKLRRCCGIAKVPETIEQVKAFLSESEDSIIAIGAHHKAVVQLLLHGLSEYNPVTIIGGDSDEARLKAVEHFHRRESRVLIANIIAAGEGLNLQFCDNFILLERQWNAAKEEQFEGRFERPKKCYDCNALLRKKNDSELEMFYFECPTCKKQFPHSPIVGEYYVASGTIDEFFTQMVEEKRKYCADTLGDQFNLETDLEGIRSLVDKVIQGGRI